MSDYIVPCAKPENDPDDWFLERDGKQYVDDVLVGPERLEELKQRAWAEGQDTDPDGREELLFDLVREEEAEVRRQGIIRRRRARARCYECYHRLSCLGLALGDNPPTHGTFGGYFSEELKEIRKLRDDRARQRNKESDDVD